MTSHKGEGDDALSKRIGELERELEKLRLRQKLQNHQNCETSSSSSRLPLELHEYVRYGRQMIMPQIGLPGQLALTKSSVLVIGAGGLGCPVLLYLVASGVGKSGTCHKLSYVDRHSGHSRS